MAGHSKWSKVKHIKGPLDRKRGQLFPELAKEITMAARLAVTTENRNRTVADPRLILPEDHGSFGFLGAVSSLFPREGRVTVPAAAIQMEQLFGMVIESGVRADFQKLTFTPTEEALAALSV